MEGNKRYAAIDIGSNAVRLLIKKAEVEGNEVSFTKELLLRVPLRLGFDVFETGRISEGKADDLKRLMKTYKHLMKIYKVDSYRACATSAMRDAENGEKIIKKIRQTTGIDIEIINGQQEAKIIYGNQMEMHDDRNGYFMYVDVGGGSTEVNLIASGELVYSQSFNIGTVRILTGGVTEAAWQYMKDEIAAHTKDMSPINIIGSGGNINKLYKLIYIANRKKKQLPVVSLRKFYEKLAPLGKEVRMKLYGMRTDRADVIVPASEIFLTIADILKSEYILVPGIGLSDGLIDAMYMADNAGGATAGEGDEGKKEKLK